MKLNFEEELLLALYLEFFNRPYTLSDERKYDVGSGIFVRHVEMQNIIYILSNLMSGFDYGFNWNWKGPYSAGLQVVLNKLDRKDFDIEKFYTEYNSKRNKYNTKYQDQLKDILFEYLTESGINKVANASFVLEDILTQEQGSEITASIIYLGRIVYPGQELSIILEELHERGYHPSPELTSAIWKDLAILGLRTKDTKEFTRERKLVSKNNGIIC